MIINYTELSRALLPHGGFYITGRFQDTDPSGNYNRVHRFFVDSDYPTAAMVTDRVDYFINNAYYDANPLNKFNLGYGNERPIVNSAAVFIRATPGATPAELVSEVDTENPDMLWKPDKFLTTMKQYLEQQMERTYTFDEFKQFLIDEKFIVVD